MRVQYRRNDPSPHPSMITVTSRAALISAAPHGAYPRAPAVHTQARRARHRHPTRVEPEVVEFRYHMGSTTRARLRAIDALRHRRGLARRRRNRQAAHSLSMITAHQPASEWRLAARWARTYRPPRGGGLAPPTATGWTPDYLRFRKLRAAERRLAALSSSGSRPSSCPTRMVPVGAALSCCRHQLVGVAAN